MKKYVVGTHNNMCIRREIEKILCGYPLLSVAMGDCLIQVAFKTGLTVHFLTLYM